MKYLLILLMFAFQSAKSQITKSSDTLHNVEYGNQTMIIYDSSSLMTLPLKSNIKNPRIGQMVRQREWVYYYYDGQNWIRLTKAND